MDCQPKNLFRAPLKGSRHDSSAATHRGGGLERGHTFRDVDIGNEHSEVAHFIFGFPRRNRGERHATGIALSPPPPHGGDLHYSRLPSSWNFRPPTSPCNDSWGVRENSSSGEGSKSGSAQSPPPPFPLTSQLKSSRNYRRGDICFAGAGSSPSASRAAFVGEKYNHPRCCFLCLRYCSSRPSPGCFLESRQRCRFPSAKMGTGSPGRAVPIRAIYRYSAWGKLEASASPAPVPRLLPPHGLAFVREKYNHPRCCFHRLRDGPPRPSSGLLP